MLKILFGKELIIILIVEARRHEQKKSISIFSLTLSFF